MACQNEINYDTYIVYGFILLEFEDHEEDDGRFAKPPI